MFGGKALGHSNTGHILPCCWVDGEVLKRHELGRKLIHPDLSIDNNETIEDILLSDAWLEWDDMLKNSPEKGHIFVTNIVAKVIRSDSLPTQKHTTLKPLTSNDYTRGLTLPPKLCIIIV